MKTNSLIRGVLRRWHDLKGKEPGGTDIKPFVSVRAFENLGVVFGLICATLNDASLARRVKYSKFSMCREIYTKIVRLTCRSDGSDGRRRRFTYHVTPDRGAPPRPRALRGCGRTAHFPAHRRPCAGRARHHPGSAPARGSTHDCATAVQSNVYTNSVPSLLPFLGPDSYASEYVAACGDGVFGFHNLTVKLAGFWNSSAAPAYHFENYAPSSRHPRPRFGPTMIYDAKVVGEDYEWMAVYACEGPPIQKKTGFSWQLLSTQRVVARKDVEDWVGKAAALGLDVDGLEFADWSKCPSWARI
jgi:hypothetical protein